MDAEEHINQTNNIHSINENNTHNKYNSVAETNAHCVGKKLSANRNETRIGAELTEDAETAIKQQLTSIKSVSEIIGTKFGSLDKIQALKKQFETIKCQRKKNLDEDLNEEKEKGNNNEDEDESSRKTNNCKDIREKSCTQIDHDVNTDNLKSKFNCKDTKEKYMDMKLNNESAASIFMRRSKCGATDFEISDLNDLHELESKDKNFGWNIFNADALYTAHEKKLKKVHVNRKSYATEVKKLGKYANDDSIDIKSEKYSVKKDALLNYVDRIKEETIRNKNYSRRRRVQGEDTTQYINKRNKVYNDKLERTFGEETAEIQSSLKRGTAL